MQDVNHLDHSKGTGVPLFAGLREESLVTRLSREASLALGELFRDPSGFFKRRFSNEEANSQLFSGLHIDSLRTRFVREVRQNTQDFVRSPSGYVKGVFTVTSREGRRLELLMWCMAFAFFAFAATFGVFFIIPHQLFHTPPPAAEEKKDLQLIAMLEPTPPPQPVPKVGGGAGLGAKKPGLGGGGGGAKELTPASKGRLPQASLTQPQIVAPSTHQHIEQPSLPVPAIIRADPALVPKQDMNLPIGDPKGVLGAPSDGPGSGGGIGTGRGGGVGSGEGGGAGPGRGGGIGGGDAGGGGGNANLRPTIISQVKPKYTEEARQNKIQGKVVLSVEFRSDGSIGDIRVIRGLGYGLDEKAIEAARLIRFRPAVQEGNPVPWRGKVEFTFNLI